MEALVDSSDRDAVLVTLSEQIASGQWEEAASELLEEQNQSIVTQLGWDILSLFTPHILTPTPTPSQCWMLVQHIANVCSPKEMSLALLEQMESAADFKVVLKLLQPLRKVVLQLENESAIVSCIQSVARLVGRAVAGSDGTTGEVDESSEVMSGSDDMLWTVSQAVQFIEPFVEQIHCSAESTDVYWSSRQFECVCFLLCLLEYPLITHKLSASSKKPNRSRGVAELITERIVQCHCGYLRLVEWEAGNKRREERAEEVCLPALGLACFCYLVLSEEMQHSYLPSVVSHNYLLHIHLQHTRALLERPEGSVAMKGLGLLKSLTSRVCPSSLPTHLLDDRGYQSLAELLSDVMVTCPHHSVRKASVPALSSLIGCFADQGRHRLYRGLLRSVSHSGVQGLLIHSIKDEVDLALKSPDDSVFLGASLATLLDLSFVISADVDLLKEMDRVMTALNLLRYLLLRDAVDCNRTRVWSRLDQLRDKFTQPLRSALQTTRLYCRQQLTMSREEGERVQGDEGPKVTVEVGGETLPDMSPEEQISVLKVAEQRLDLLESVLVRTEELMQAH